LWWTSISFEFGNSHSPFSSVGSEAEVLNFFKVQTNCDSTV
jgi:hypothetical protein